MEGLNKRFLAQEYLEPVQDACARDRGGQNPWILALAVFAPGEQLQSHIQMARLNQHAISDGPRVCFKSPQLRFIIEHILRENLIEICPMGNLERSLNCNAGFCSIMFWNHSRNNPCT